MATREQKGKDIKPGVGKGKLTVVMFQLEGDDVTLQDAIRFMGQGMEKLSSANQSVRVLPPSRNGGSAALPSGNDTDQTIEGDLGDEDPDIEGDEEDNKPAPKKRRNRIMKALVPLKDVDWDSEASFKEYCTQHQAKNNNEKFLVIAGWFKNHRNDEIVTAAHIVAGYDYMDWIKPENIPQDFSSIKHKNEWFDKGTKRGQWVISQRGINHLARLGRGNGETEA
jgi:hypothetical protein